ncbi:IFT88 protein, partial [Amia calva]|nr:IFT88 protein [Amia calva]
MAHSHGDHQLSLEKAKEAGRKERALARHREQTGSSKDVNLDLTYSFLLNLAIQYSNNGMYTEALNTYKVIVESKTFQNVGRIKVNMADIFFKQKNYPKALKFYRMAVDHVSHHNKEMRMRIMENISVVLIKLGKYTEAITSMEDIMMERPDIKTASNLIVCSYGVGDSERMKKAFQELVCVPLGIDEYLPPNDDPNAKLVFEVIQNDQLRQMERERKALAEKYIMASAKLIAPVIELSSAAGFDWCVEVLKSSQYAELANDLEMSKAVASLRHKDFTQAVEMLKVFAKKDSRVKSEAASNLSALYFLDKDYGQAERYADLARSADRYNPAALVSKGNTLFAKSDYKKAAGFYKEALRNDSSCTEALYNLGLTYKKLSLLEEALGCFLKLHTILRTSAQVMYQLANLYEMQGDPHQAIEWLMRLISQVPTDSQVLAKLGELHDDEGDKSQAFQYYYESFRYFPSNIDVIKWLGGYYISTQAWEKGIQYLEKAALIQPTQVKWRLMVASCYRRSGNYQKALETYKDIHRKFPDNVKCLQFLVRFCSALGLKEGQDYATQLKKVEKMKERREQRVKSGRQGSVRGRREGSASSVFPESRHSPVLEQVRDSGHCSCGTSAKRERLSAMLKSLPGASEPYEASSNKDIGKYASYIDPLGPQMERPKTAAKKWAEENYFANEELGRDLLPE